MEIKKHLVLFNTLMLCVFAAQASPLVSLGDYGNIFFDGSYSTIWRSNVLFAEDDEEEDLLFIVSPGLEIDLGSQVSNFDLNLFTKYDIQRYDELTDFDREYFSIRGTSSYDAVRWNLTGSGSFEERESTTGQEGANRNNSVSTNNLILLEITNANLNLRYQISPKFGFNPGVRYYNRRYTNSDQLADNEQYSLPVDFSYKLTPKVDLTVGYRYVTNDIGSSNQEINRLFRVIDPDTGEIDPDTGGILYEDRFVSGSNQISHFFNVGANGKLLPKLNGFFKIGYTVVDPEDADTVTTPVETEEVGIETLPNGDTQISFIPNQQRVPVTGANPRPGQQKRDSRSTLGLSGDLTYLITPKLTSSMKLNRGFDVGSEGQTVLDSSARINASYAISAKYFASSFLSYTLREFEDGGNPGDDDIYEAGVNLSYVPDQYLRFSTGYSFIENNSERQNQGFVNHSVNLSVSFRY